MNREWHEQNKLDAKASLDDRVAWHLAHAANCACRPIPAPVLKEIERRRIVAVSTNGTHS